jgi:cobalt-zinc-cadmium efflux system membrane fusion protein
VPTVLIVAALAGVAWWGHATDWKLPTFASLAGEVTATPEPWCTDHNVPDAICIECRPNLQPLETNHGWCKEHGLIQCPLEHPELAQLKATPTISQDMRERAARALAIRPRIENNSRCTLHQRRIQFASAEAVDKVGVDIALAQQRTVIESVPANGEITYDQTRMAHLSSRVAGSVWRVEKQVGDRVAKGDVLALIDSGEVGRAKNEFLQAVAHLRLQTATVERLRPLGDGVITGRQLREAEAAFEEARIRLHGAQQALVNLGLPTRFEDLVDVGTDEISRRLQFLGLPESYTRNLDAESTTSNLFPLRAPLDGVVIERHVVEGEVVDSSTDLFGVADVSRLWLTLSVQQEDAAYVALGQPVIFHPTGSPVGTEARGVVSWISTTVDDETRTIAVRVELPNDDGHLRNNTFGLGHIVLREEPAAIVLPNEAVHWDGTCHVVFVRDKNYLKPEAPKFFHVRAVRLGVKDADSTEIIAGLLPGEVVASKNSTVLEAQLLKSNLGAGCCEVHAAK